MDTKPTLAEALSDYENHKLEYDASTFTNESFIDIVPMEWGKIAVWSPPGLPYIGKELRIDEGKNIPINISDRFRILTLRDGKATIVLEDAGGQVHRSIMEYAKGYRIHSGQKYGIESEGFTRIIEGSENSPTAASPRDKFSVEEYVIVDNSKPWGNEPIFSRKDLHDPIAMKILHIEEDGWLSLQAHSVKVESYYMSYGTCHLVMEDTNRQLMEFPLEFNKGYTTKVGQRHRHKGITRMDVFEVSTAEDGSTTWRIEDKYARGDQTDEVRRQERGEI